MATEQVKVLKIDTNPAQTSVKDLRNELKALKDTMLSTEQGTEEYNAALKQAAEIQHTLKEQMEEVNASAMDFGQIVSNCTKAVGGLVGGFQAATAVMNLFGVENEDVIKTLKTMQQLMALTQALPAIDNGVKAFKRLALTIKASSSAMQGFSKAAIATGLGAIVAALGLLIANWDKVTAAMQKWGIISEDTTKKIEEQKKALDDWKTALDKAKGELQNQETTDKISKMNEKAKKSYDDLTKSITNLQLQQKVVEADRQIAWREEGKNSEKAQKLTASFNDLTAQIDALRKSQRALLDDAESYKELPKTIGNAVDSSKKQLKELEILLWDISQKLTPQSLQDELMNKYRDNPVTIPVKIEIDEDEEEDTSIADAYRKKVETIVGGLRDAFGTSEAQRYEEEQRALEVALNTKLISQEEYYRLSESLAKEHSDVMKQQAVAEAQVWMNALSNLGSIFSSMADMIDTSTEEGQEKYRALMYTSVIISTLAGIGGAIASAFNPANSYLTIFGQIAMAATTAGSVLASGIAQLMQIKNANQNSSLGGSNFSSPSTGAVTTLIAPVQYTQDVQGANIEGAIRNSKVYVTETDITNTQNRVKVSETEARY